MAPHNAPAPPPAPAAPPAFPKLLYGHRGAAAERPENTLASFARALEAGADALEMDVHMTADGHVVVAHDPTGLRMAGVPRAIRACSLAEVQGWDVGWGFVDAAGERPFVGRGHTIPTLERVLAEFADVTLNIDVKQAAPPMARAVVELLQRHGAAARVRLTSFDVAVIRAVRALGYQGPTGMAQREVLGLLATPVPALALLARRSGRLRADAAQLPVRVGRVQLATPSLIAKCHALGLRVDYWVVNDPDEARRLFDLGADGVVTDDPARLAPVLRAVRGATAHRA